MRSPAKSMVCFSLAAYAKALIAGLRASGLPVATGLSDVEFASIESLFGFSFPPELRAVLREGLPIAPGFPDWRSSSTEQLRVIASLPVSHVAKQVSLGRFWTRHWGPRPENPNVAAEVARQFLRRSPALIPVFRNCYVPSSTVAGGPVFRVDSDGVKVQSFDLPGFFHGFSLEFGLPAWAAKVPRRVEFWSDVAACHWWVSPESEHGVGACMDMAVRRLRDGGWGEEDVREMVMMDFPDGSELRRDCRSSAGEGLMWRVRMLSLILLRAGWAKEDVVDSLGVSYRWEDESECVLLDGDCHLRCN